MIISKWNALDSNLLYSIHIQSTFTLKYETTKTDFFTSKQCNESQISRIGDINEILAVTKRKKEKKKHFAFTVEERRNKATSLNGGEVKDVQQKQSSK